MENRLVQTNAVENPNFAAFFRESLRKLSDEQYFASLPAGYRFKPTHDELIVHYLMKKIKKQELPRNKIKEVKLYEFNPEKLAEKYRNSGEKEWFFFTSRQKKYKKGKRPDRAAGDGYWKASGADTVIKHNGVDVGSRKTLVYYEGKPPSAKNKLKKKEKEEEEVKEKKTSWIMHEYTVINPPPVQEQTADEMRLDDYVLCRIRKNENKKRKRDDQIQEPDNKTNEVPRHQEDIRKDGKDSAIVAPEELLPYNKSEIAMADSFLNDNDNDHQNILTNPDNDHQNTQYLYSSHESINPQHQNAFAYYNQVPVPNVPPNYSNGGYVYSGFPVRYVADVEGEQHQELPGILEMDLKEYFHCLVTDHGDQIENPGLDDTDDSLSLEDSDKIF